MLDNSSFVLNASICICETDEDAILRTNKKHNSMSKVNLQFIEAICNQIYLLKISLNILVALRIWQYEYNDCIQVQKSQYGLLGLKPQS